MNNDITNIVEGCRRGDPYSQQKLYKLLAGRLMSVCMRYVRSRPEAEDCLQESFIKIFGSINEYKGEGVIDAWARRLTVNTVINYLRTQKRFYEELDVEEFHNAVPIEHEGEASMETQELYAIIGQLPELYKNIFNLYVIEGYNHKEIAEMVGINESSSRTYLTRAKQMLVKIHSNINNQNETVTRKY